jgi:serine/threonine protein kinase
LHRLNSPTSIDQLYYARRLVDGSDVAVRVFGRMVANLRDRERCLNEIAELKALVDIASVLPVLDADVRPDGQVYLVTAFCPAGSLHDQVLVKGGISAIEAHSVAVQLASALDAVHKRGIIHRNITPSNVLIGSAGEPLLTGFGLVSLSVSGSFDLDSAREHTPFLAPEAYLPELMTPAADIYALGATLYALLAGPSAPGAALPGQSYDAGQVPRLRGVSGRFMWVLRRMTAEDPRERFRSCADLLAVLPDAI